MIIITKKNYRFFSSLIWSTFCWWVTFFRRGGKEIPFSHGLARWDTFFRWRDRAFRSYKKKLLATRRESDPIGNPLGRQRRPFQRMASTHQQQLWKGEASVRTDTSGTAISCIYTRHGPPPLICHTHAHASVTSAPLHHSNDQRPPLLTRTKVPAGQ